ncbi:MAG: glycosyltransferase family 2 protein [Alphaproteobacteria bacterium]|nr:glycosyltransferase family 2 protein [Alphaproteobacteria bacterium]
MQANTQSMRRDDCVGLPTYSVVIPVNGDGTFLSEAVTSVLHQSHPPNEIILVNDLKSTDAAKFVLPLPSSDDRIHVLNTTGDVGAGLARNQGMEFCSGEYIAFLDCDDIWVADKMAHQLMAMCEREAAFSATRYGTIIADQIIKNPRKKYSGWVTWFWLLANNPIGTSSVVVHKDVNLRFSRLKRRQDWAAWIELIDSGQKCWILDEVLMYHRVGHSEHSLSSRKMACIKYHWNVLRRTADRGLISSALFTSASTFFWMIRTATLKLHKIWPTVPGRSQGMLVSPPQVHQPVGEGRSK